MPFLWDIRLKEREVLEDFCEKEPLVPFAIQLFTGAGGIGKTRLMVEWTAELQSKGWKACFILQNIAAADLAQLVAGDEPVFLVIDYAECRPDLTGILKTLITSRLSPRVRVVLLARHAEHWWHALKASQNISPYLCHQVFYVQPIQDDTTTRETIFRQALSAFKKPLNKTVSEDRIAQAENMLSQPIFDKTLYIHMAAYATADGESYTADTLLNVILEREKYLWPKYFQEHFEKMTQEKRFLDQTSRVMAAVTLLGGLSIPTLHTLIPEVEGPDLADFPDFIQQLYPQEEAEQDTVSVLEPDLLGEYLIWDTIRELKKRGFPLTVADFLEKTLRMADSDEMCTQVFLVLGRIMEHSEWVDEAGKKTLFNYLCDLLDKFFDSRAPEGAIMASLILGEETAFSQIPSILKEVFEKNRKNYEKNNDIYRRHAMKLMAEWLHEMIPGDSTSSRPLKLSLDEFCVADYTPELIALLPVEEQIKAARNYEHYIQSLMHMNKYPEAKEAADQAAAIYSSPALESTDKNVFRYAKVLNDRCLILMKMERIDEAYEDIDTVIRTYQGLIGKNFPGARLALAKGLHNLANTLSKKGEVDKAVEIIAKAVGECRKLAEEENMVVDDDLANCLSDQGNILELAGHHKEALAAAEESACIFRDFSAQNPDTFLPVYAAALSNLGNKLYIRGDYKRAKKIMEEAVVHRRKLSEFNPEAFRVDLATSLNNLSSICSHLGEGEKSAAAIQEAVEIYTSPSGVDLSKFATSLHNRALRHYESGDYDDAIACAEQAIQLRQARIKKLNTDESRAELAGTQSFLGKILSSKGIHPRAIQESKTAVDEFKDIHTLLSH